MNDSWRDGLRLKLEAFVDAMVVNGAKQLYDAIVEKIGSLRTAYERDPDRAEDRLGADVEEPSNDWPDALR